VDRCADLDAYSGRQQQQDAQQRRIRPGIVALSMIVHDRTIPGRIRLPASRGPVAAANIEGAA
jgi:uncharacterized protein (UPF0147 family)